MKLECAFNILGHPERRAHYDSLLVCQKIHAVFPYGGAGSLPVAGERSRAQRPFLPNAFLRSCLTPHRRFHTELKNCEFHADKALCRTAWRSLQFWLDPAVAQISCDPSWIRWKHQLGAKITT
jgi:hypothetical protein